jgi:hypothetical protein
MNDDRVILSRQACNALMDAVQRAIIDRGASKATRRAAFSALLALVDAGLIIGNPSMKPPDRDETRTAEAPVSTKRFVAG